MMLTCWFLTFFVLQCKKLEREIIELHRSNEGLAVKSDNDKSLRVIEILLQLFNPQKQKSGFLIHS